METPRSTRPRRTEKQSAQSQSPFKTAARSEPPLKRRKYIPGGPGGGGRYVDDHGNEIPVGGTGPGGYNYIGPRGRIGRENLANGVKPVVYTRRRDRDRTRPAASRPAPSRRIQPTMGPHVSAAQAAAAVQQNDGYKPREERPWEEFHPDLDINSDFMAFSADAIDGILPPSRPVTPTASLQINANGARTPNGAKSDGGATPTGSSNGEAMGNAIPGTPGGKRGPGRPPKNPQIFYASRAVQLGNGHIVGDAKPAAPDTPKVVPLQNATAKERLSLPTPKFRLTKTLEKYDKEGMTRYVDKSMRNVGYQESDEFIRHELDLIKASDINFEEDLGDAGCHIFGRVEYDMDEQDDIWLDMYNEERKAGDHEAITREFFEITITKIEKEWHALEKRIPKPNPKAPQTHRPRSSSAAAVNGEPLAGEEQDSKCAVCDDGDCENTNAIVFCDGCDLAVHQECYGVPFIPEGQWLCRKCQLIGRGVPTCMFCPNTDGAFKQTNASKWAHLLCAIWIPEVSLGNVVFMEPVQDVEKVPKSRWKLTCYICNQQMGACIQCGNRACYKAFHVTCARRCQLYLKMKNNHGQLSIIDGATPHRAFCHEHCPPDHMKENDVPNAYREAVIFYKKAMRGRIWADNQQAVSVLSASHRHAVTEHPHNESQLTGASNALVVQDMKRKSNQPPAPVWKLPSGAPVVPQVLFTSIDSSLQRFGFTKRKEFTAEVCKYWTLKRESRRGAALLKRLQLQMDNYSSGDLTRRNFPAMGHVGRERLNRRIEFNQKLVEDLKYLVELAGDVREREKTKLEKVRNEADLVDAIYFPVARLLPAVVESTFRLDTKKVFTQGLATLRDRVDARYYISGMAFAQDLSLVFVTGIKTEPKKVSELTAAEAAALSANRIPYDIRERKNIAKRIIRSIMPKLREAVRAEADISQTTVDPLLEQLSKMLHTRIEEAASKAVAPAGSTDDPAGKSNALLKEEPDTVMVDAAAEDIEESIHVVAEDHIEAGEQFATENGHLVDVNGNISQHVGGSLSSRPAESGNDSSEENNLPSPSSTLSSIPNGDVTDLTNGGIPKFLNDAFLIDGTSVVPNPQPEPAKLERQEPESPKAEVEVQLQAEAELEVALSDDLSELEDADFTNMDEANFGLHPVAVPALVTEKKEKIKKRRRDRNYG